MVIRVRSRERAKEKFRKRVEVAAPDYEYGVRNPRYDWLERFSAAADAIAEALRKAAEEKRHLAGAQRAGTKRWQDQTSRKGVPRWRDETPKAADLWRSAFEDFASELERLALSPRRPKGDPANIDLRVKPVVEALRRKKLELRGVKTS